MSGRASVRLVFAGVHIGERSRLKRLLQRLMSTALLPHYWGTLRLAAVIARSDTRPVVLVPSNFMQNDEVFRDDILAGTFPEPLASVNRVDLRDVAEVAVRALRDEAVPPGAYPVVGPASLSGRRCAMVWQEVLARPVHYVGDDRAAWTAAFRQRLSGQKLTDWTASFRVLGRLPVRTVAAEVAETHRLLGHAPRSYEAYVADMAAFWRPSTVSA